MRWYLLKTWAGREEAFAEEIRKILPSCLYHECFAIYQERIWRKQQKSIVHTELLFPGCVFLTCEDGEELTERIWGNFTKIKGTIHGMTAVLPMMPEDAKLLEEMSGKNHLVRLSYVDKDGQGKVCGLSKPLKLWQGQIERIQYKKRFAMVRCRLWGEEQVIVLGIVLKEDICPIRHKNLDRDIKDQLDYMEETGVAF